MLDNQSIKMLVGVHPDLKRVASAVSDIKGLPGWRVTFGVRTLAQEQYAILHGYSSLKNPHDCRHVPSGKPPVSHAIDISVLINGKPTWANQYIPAYIKIGEAFQQVSKELNIPIRSGYLWMTFKDYGHHELPIANYP